MTLNIKLRKAFEDAGIDTFLYDGKKQDEGKICLALEINTADGFYWSETIKIYPEEFDLTIGEFSERVLNQVWSKFDSEKTIRSYERYLGEAEGCETEEAIINNVRNVEKKLDNLMDSLSKLFESHAKVLKNTQERDRVS
jgi:hypothetical protein